MVAKKIQWNLMEAGAAAAAGVGVRYGLRAGWRAWRKEDPPLQPAAADTPWRDALAWTAATGLLVGLGRLAARRGLAAGWVKARGRLPGEAKRKKRK